MMAIYRKELRENLRWAAIFFVILLGWFAYAISGDAQSQMFGMMSAGFGEAATAGCAVGGAALGLLQVLQDRRRGRWDFVFHRPLSLRRMLAAKLFAGATLYFAAAGLALVAAISWLAAPGSIGVPFEPLTILPRMMDLLCGFMWYLTGVFVAARQARWIGSRLFPFGWAFAVTFLLHFATVNFSIAAALLALGAAIVFPSAWCIFAAMGDSERRALPVRAAIGISVLIGVALLVGAGAGVLTTGIGLLDRAPTNSSWNYYGVLRNGQVALIHYDQGEMQSVTTPQGAKVPGIDSKKWGDIFPTASATVSLLSDPQDRKWYEWLRYTGFYSPNAYSTLLDSSAGCTWSWSESRRVIEGFAKSTRRLVTVVDKNGSHSSNSPATPFDKPLQRSLEETNHAYTSGTTIPLFDDNTAWIFVPAQSYVTPVIRALPGEVLVDSNQITFNSAPKWRPPIDVAVSNQHIYIQPGDAPGFSAVLPPHRSMANLDCYVIDGGRYVLLLQSYGPVYSGSAITIDGTGKILKTETLPPLPMNEVAQLEIETFVMGLAAPPIVAPIGYWMTRDDPNQHQTGMGAWPIAVTFIVSPIWAVWLIRRRNLSRAAAIYWLIFSALAGVSGPLLLICTRSRAVRLTCPACGKPRLITRELCEHCGQPFPPPALQGIEIFVDAANESDAVGLAIV